MEILFTWFGLPQKLNLVINQMQAQIDALEARIEELEA